MISVILTAILAAALAGLVIRYALLRWSRDLRITWSEYTVGMLAISFVVSPVVAVVGWKVVQGNNLSFNEYWNGWETKAVKQRIECTRDGPCYWEYNCDPYRCNPHDCNCVCVSRDEDGRCTSESCDTCWDTCYHDCPYVTDEYDYLVDSTIGPFTIASHVFPVNPDSHRWRAGTRVPDEVIARAGVGDPLFWTDAKRRCDADVPGPVTRRSAYDNYVLASEGTILKEYSGDIADYRDAGLLPRLNGSVQEYYHADKVYFVGFRPADAPAWNRAAEFLNAQLGRELQGDLHLVVIRDGKVTANPDRYAYALKAHWQDKAEYGDDTLAKNGIVILIGTADGATVAWSRAFTGMPMGNEKLLVVLRDGLKGLPLHAVDLIGPGASQRVGAVTRHPRNIAPAALERVLWGLDDASTKFTRLEMTGPDGQSGYLYLRDEIRLSENQTYGVFAVVLAACLLVWLFFAFFEHRRLQ
ncbi:MAG TPA: hypothetical protein VD862_00635 [Candidatus Paceibacterota bacterium]|nr:hypothetical protein [Candidatus Paceibacterota bacterium]